MKVKTNDPLIRESLKFMLSTTDDVRILEEFCIADKGCRVDVVTVGSTLQGYEIKSDVDTLARLARQVEYYDSIFQYNWVVVGGSKLKKLDDLLPKHWGIIRADQINGLFELCTIRPAKKNPHMNIASVLKLLWKEELIEILLKHGFPVSTKYRRKSTQRAMLRRKLDREQLMAEVLIHLRKRIYRIKE